MIVTRSRSDILEAHKLVVPSVEQGYNQVMALTRSFMKGYEGDTGGCVLTAT
jgi:hypothetical protein